MMGDEQPRAFIDIDLRDLVPGYMRHRLEELQAGFDALRIGDFARLQRIGHNVKGSAGGYGFVGLTTIGNRLESAAAEHDAQAVAYSLEALASYLRRVEIVYLENVNQQRTPTPPTESPIKPAKKKTE